MGTKDTVADRLKPAAPWLVIIAAMIITAAFLFEFGRVFEEHTLSFIAAWFGLLFAAVLLHPAINCMLATSQIIKVRIALTLATALISLSIFAQSERIQNELGRRYIQGYWVSHYEETGPYGAEVYTEVFADHWYTKVLVWGLRWFSLFPLVGVPWATWRSGTRAIMTSIGACGQAVRINPQNASLWKSLGKSYAWSHQTTMAIQAFQQALLLINPQDAFVWHKPGVLYGASGQREKAMEVYERLKALDPRMAKRFFNKVVLP